MDDLDAGRVGPLSDVTVLELGGLGPVPFAGMILADLGAKVVCLERPDKDPRTAQADLLRRGKSSLQVNLKATHAAAMVQRLVEGADVLLEGFRPGVAERLGMGPTPCLKANPRLIYGRMTGYGQTGPLAQVAGHDINFIALSGVLKHIGSPDRPPVPPINLIGDFAGGGMYLALGVLSGLLKARSSGHGDVVDAAMTDGASILMTMFHGMVAESSWSLERGTNAFDGGAPFVQAYETSDGEYVAVGAVEDQFYRALTDTLDLNRAEMFPQMDRTTWPLRRSLMARAFKSRSQSDWCAVFAEVDACFSPVLSMTEAANHPQAKARQSFLEIAGVRQPAPGPRFLSGHLKVPDRPPVPGANSRATLASLGVPESEVDRWFESETLKRM